MIKKKSRNDTLKSASGLLRHFYVINLKATFSLEKGFKDQPFLKKSSYDIILI